MRIYCDIDDILSETARSLLVLARESFGRVCRYEEVTGFDLQKVFSLSDAEMRRFSLESHSYANLTAYEPVPGAVEGVKALTRSGNVVELVTGRPANSWRATRDWLDKVGLGEYPVLYVDKYNRAYPQEADSPRTVPLSEFLTYRYDVAIDDSPVALKSLAVWRETKVLVFNRPWNAAFTLAPNMTRVNDWNDIKTSVLKA